MNITKGYSKVVKRRRTDKAVVKGKTKQWTKRQTVVDIKLHNKLKM